MYALTGCTLYTSDQVLEQFALVIEGARILELRSQVHLEPHIPQINGRGLAVAPGFLDLQLNGCGGVMFNDAITAKTLDTMHRTNLRSGTTSFLPTLITTSNDAIRQAMDLVHNYRQQYPYRVLGLHLEGPYLNPGRRGIHDASFIRPPDSQMVDALTKAGSEVVKLVTLAPEMVSASLIEHLIGAGIVVSAGHTEASFETALAGFDAGISMVTHLFNAMSPWLGRTPGVVGATLCRANVYAGVIVDGHHVHYGSIQLAHRIKQDRLFLVTDATPPAGAQVESFVIGGQEVFYKDGKCVSAEGTLGGSALTMIEAVQNCVQHVEISLAEALRMATLYPAQAIGMAQQLGRLAPGYRADIILFDPKSFRVKGVIEQGQLTWFSPESSASVLKDS